MKKLYYLLCVLIFICSCKSGKQKSFLTQNDCERFGCIDAYRYLALSTAPFSITEDEFWYRGSLEHAKLTVYDLFNEGFIEAIKSKKRISRKDGLGDNFEYAFINRKEKDTIYASFYRNLWTIKVDGAFEYYEDEHEELKSEFQQYSGFFSNCW